MATVFGGVHRRKLVTVDGSAYKCIHSWKWCGGFSQAKSNKIIPQM